MSDLRSRPHSLTKHSRRYIYHMRLRIGPVTGIEIEHKVTSIPYLIYGQIYHPEFPEKMSYGMRTRRAMRMTEQSLERYNKQSWTQLPYNQINAVIQRSNENVFKIRQQEKEEDREFKKGVMGEIEAIGSVQRSQPSFKKNMLTVFLISVMIVGIDHVVSIYTPSVGKKEVLENYNFEAIHDLESPYSIKTLEEFKDSDWP